MNFIRRMLRTRVACSICYSFRFLVEIDPTGGWSGMDVDVDRGERLLALLNPKARVGAALGSVCVWASSFPRQFTTVLSTSSLQDSSLFFFFLGGILSTQKHDIYICICIYSQYLIKSIIHPY